MKLRMVRICLALSTAVTSVAAAQELRGTVRDSASAQPIAGAVLVLLDSVGQTLGRNITDERGQYRIALSRSIRQMRLLRIGFRPRTVAVPPVASGVARVDIVMVLIPAFLEPVRVVDQPNCPRRADASRAFALWEQAKAALLATVVARETQPATALRFGFDRRMRERDRIVHQIIRKDSLPATRPFQAARRAAEFVEDGFVVDTGGARLFAAPDADVLLDDAFATGYCFRIADAAADRPSEIGLAFAPATTKRGRVEIEGAVWIDSTTRALTRLDYRYRGLDADVRRLEPGGHVEFRAMPNGTVMIDRWFIRVAVADTSGGKRMFGTVALEAHEIGGEVATAIWTTGHAWSGSLGTLRGRIVPPPVAGTVVRLLDTPYEATADSVGRFEIPHLLPGPYAIAVLDPRVAELGILLRTGIEFTAVRDSTTTLLVEVPTLEQYAAATCTGDANIPGGSTFIVRVELPDGSPAKKAKIRMHQWGDDNPSHVIRGETDGNGLAHLCRAPRSGSLEVRADYPGMSPAIQRREMNASVVTLVLRLTRAPSR